MTGVGSGIGRLTAELMARRGWRVAGTSRDPRALATWAQEHGVMLFPLDVTSEREIAAVVPEAAERLGRLDALVNNAGYGLFGPLEGADAEEVERQLRTNVLAPISLSRACMPIMRAQGGGTIVNVSSIGGRTASPLASLYHASKFAIEGFSESFRYEAALHGVRVKLVEPSHFRTGFIARSLRLARHPAYETAVENYMEWVHDEDAKAPTAEPVAEAILRAAEDPSTRLRYPVKGAFILAMTTLLPDAMWRPLLAEGMRRRPKRRATANLL